MEKENVNTWHPFIGAFTSQGDAAHKAASARTTFGVNGAGIKIGVLSDSYNNKGGAAGNVTAGDLPGTTNPNGFTTPVTVLSDYPSGQSDEGRAMLQIVHDIAPGARLYFATAFTSEGAFAQNILNLRAAGCDIICDDVFYLDEPVFYDGIVAQAVNSVTNAGALYFSSAGNQGNKTGNTSSVWEGDFVNGGAASSPLPPGNLNAFSAGINYNQLTRTVSPIVLFWSDPPGGSTNDYDLYVLNAAMSSVLASSTTTQNGSQNPMEYISASQASGRRIVILKKTTAAVRALHLNTFGGGTSSSLSINTQGQTHGHSSAANAFSCAATPAASSFCGGANYPPGPYPSAYNTSNKVECFSSDGPRRKFYNAAGAPVTPGNLLFGTAGGVLLQKPDISAADGVVTAGFASTTGLNPFYGTSAAAPHAAAIAALIKQFSPGLTTAQLRSTITSTAIDIETGGPDRNSGYGIIMAYEAIQSLGGCTAAGIVTQPSNSNVCSGTNAAFSVVASGTSPAYQWQVSTSGCGGAWVNLTNAAPYSGVTAATLNITAATTGMNGYAYRVVVSNTCPSTLNSNCATLSVSTLLNPGTVSGATAICIDSSATFTSNGDPGGTWSSDNTNVAIVNATSGLVSGISAGSALITYSLTNSCGTPSASKSIDITSCAAPTLEAEDAVLSGAVVASNQPGFTGSGFADYIHAAGDFIEWTVNASTLGSYLLQFRYANGGTANRPLQLKVNDVVVNASLAFSPTGSFATWSVSSATANLLSGTNKVRLTAIGSGGPNVDNLKVDIVACQSGTLEAELALLSGAVAASNQPGFTGTGFADYVNASSDFIEWTLNTSAAGSFSLQFRYANGGASNRPLQLRINNAVVNASLAFAPTGSFATWSFSSATVNLIAGANKVRLTATGSSGPNVDHLAFDCNNSIQSVQLTAPAKNLLPASPDLLSAHVVPNPVSGNTKLILSASSHLPVNFQLVDMLGRSYKSLNLIPGGSNTFDLSVNDLAPGSYIIILKQGNLSTHARLVVVRK